MSVSGRIAVPDGWPCDFRVSLSTLAIADCRVCGRAVGAWSGCPSVQAATEGRLWDDMAVERAMAERRRRGER
jgi:hypothetical protein